MSLALDSPDADLAISDGDIAARSPLELFWRRLRQDRVALVALGFIAALVLAAVFAGVIVDLAGTTGPNIQNQGVQDAYGDPTGPSAAHPFGVDRLGRDVFARVLYGARVSLGVALGATALCVVIGVVVGLLAAFYRGWVDTLLSRAMDVILAFPILLLALGIAAACSLGDGCVRVNLSHVGVAITAAAVALGVLTLLWVALRGLTSGASRSAPAGRWALARLAPWLVLLVAGLALALLAPEGSHGLLQPGLSVVIFVIAFANWPYIGRIIRGQVLSLREKEFVEAARSLGASNRRIILRELLPNLVAPIIVYSTLVIPQNILFEAALSFLGVGVQPPQPSWGAMIADAIGSWHTAWWYLLFPGLALVLTVLSFNLVGDGLQDALNPRTAT